MKKFLLSTLLVCIFLTGCGDITTDKMVRYKLSQLEEQDDNVSSHDEDVVTTEEVTQTDDWYSPYASTIVYGSTVKDILSAHVNDIAILINTDALDSAYEYYEHYAFNYGDLLTTNGNAPTSANKPEVLVSEDIGVTNTYVNKYSETGTASVIKDTSSTNYVGSLYKEDGTIITSTNIVDVYNEQSAEYIGDDMEFASNLITDSDGNVIGILFRQI